MKKHQEEMLFRTAANSYVEKEGEEIQKEMENVDEIFVKMAAENHKEFEKILDREFGTKKKRRPMLYKVATILLFLILGFGVSVMTVPALKNAVIDFVNYVTGEYSEVGDSPDKDLKSKNLDSRDGFKKEYHINYLPKGFVLLEKSTEENRILYNYMKDGHVEQWIAFSQMKKEFSTNIDTEAANVELVQIGGQDAFVIDEDESIIVIIKKNEYELVLESLNVTRKEMLMVAESIR